jgi:hypothetical protein
LVARMLDHTDCGLRVVADEVHVVSAKQSAARGSVVVTSAERCGKARWSDARKRSVFVA